ncbi:MAG: DMT family transporter [Ignavibacteriaceae bacterium]
MKKYIGESALLTNTLIWGGTFVIIKTALNDVSPMLFIAIRFSLAAILFLPFIFKIFRGINRDTFIGGIVLGALFFLGFAAQTLGLNYTTATKSGFITGTFVIFIPIFQLLIQKKTPKKSSLIGIAIVIIGLLFLSSKGENIFAVFLELGSGFNLGDFLTLICALFFGLYVVCVDLITKKNPYMPLVFLQISITGISGIIISLILFIFNIEEIRFSLTSNLIFAILYTSLLATIITTILQTRFQKKVSPSRAGIILSFEPIFAALAAFLILGEKVSTFGFLGGILIFTGLVVSEIFD